MLKIFKEIEEKDVYLKLEDTGNHIVLVLCNSKGKLILGGNMAEVDKRDGGIHRNEGVVSTVGLDLDEDGRIKIK